MKPYSQDLRQRVLHAIDTGQSQTVVAQTFSVSIATIKRYLKRRREEGHVLPKAIPGRPSIKGAALRAGLLDQLKVHPDATREQHCQMWEVRTGTKVSPASISRARMALGWTRKKKSFVASEQDEAERAVWREQAKQLPTQDLVIVDETGANLTLIASLSVQGIGEAMLLDGSADSAAFEVYIEQILAPSLRPGQIVILDNLSIHLGSRVKEAIEERGCQLLFLPAYSPDFSPIEEAFSKLETILRRAGARTREALQDVIIHALPTITAKDALGWFRHCGCPTPETAASQSNER